MAGTESPAGPARHTMSIEPSRAMRVAGFDHDHEITVALPASYHQAQRSYPVLWVTDGSLMFHLAVGVLDYLAFGGEAPEMIVVGVGSAREVDRMEWIRSRSYDFFPADDVGPSGFGGAPVRARIAARQSPLRGGGAARFLDFLVDDVRSALAADYRMEADDHGLLGHSAGGMFVASSVFTRPGAFAKYLSGSSTMSGNNYGVFELEERYASENDDLRARVFLGSGEAEASDPTMTAWSTVGGLVRLGETLAMRNYPSLHVTTRVFASETHWTMPPLLISCGVRALWGPPAREATGGAAPR